MKKEMNNKGFSLVELIIVIAIMVILIAVLAPQYLKYVEKSRVSSDAQTVVEFISAMQTAAADEDAKLLSTESYTVTAGSGTAAVTVSPHLKDVLGTRIGVMDSNTMDNTTLQSTAYTNANLNLVLSYNTTRKVWEVTASTTVGDVGISGAINK